MNNQRLENGFRFIRGSFWPWGFSLLLLVLGSALHLSGSPIHSWDNFIRPGIKSPGLIWGTPRATRSEEWSVRTPFYFSQHNLGYPQENRGLEAEKAPLLFGLE
ncbi:MAG: hypothetical protein IT292_10735 [Deltaproteobacteria bacterium]|nr:hypothetical protein [Deltaproteobacteria bacterium]